MTVGSIKRKVGGKEQSKGTLEPVPFVCDFCEFFKGVF